MANQSPHAQLLDGIKDVKSRKDGSVHTIRSNGKVVAEVCVGKKATRLNFRSRPKLVPKSVALTGKSTVWAGGGLIVTETNLAAAKSILSALLKGAAPKPAAKRPARSSARPAS